MKAALLLLLTLGLSSTVHAQPGQWQFTINNNWGYTVVNVPAAVEIPEISGGEGLSNWNQFNYRGMAQFLYRSSETVSFGPEIGVSRLYFWEERYIPLGQSPRYRWETVWTGFAGGLVRLDLGAGYYVMAGASIHTFFNGTGTTVGIPLGVGHTISVTDRFNIPLEFRVDIIFGDAVPIGLGGGVGLQFNLAGNL